MTFSRRPIRSSIRRSGRRRVPYWSLAYLDGAQSVTGKAIVGMTVGGSFQAHSTLIAIRGRLTAYVNTDAQSGVLGIGIIIANADAFAAGAASLPGALSDGAAPFIWHAAIPLIGTGGLDSRARVAFEPFYSRAMRKLKDTDVIAVVAETSGTVTAGGGISVLFSMRSLFKAP